MAGTHSTAGTLLGREARTAQCQDSCAAGPHLSKTSHRTSRTAQEARRPANPRARDARPNASATRPEGALTTGGGGGGGGGGSRTEAYLKPTPAEVTTAVESLYADRLKPFGRILLKRLRELHAQKVTQQKRQIDPEAAAVEVDGVPLIEPRSLRSLCESCSNLSVEAEDGKEYSVLLEGKPRDFVEVCSPDDIYDESMWSQAAAYLESLSAPEMTLPGGRYACAQVLMSRDLPWLKNKSLGEVCHIVQLAVSQKRLLGYLEGNMVPFNKSVDWIKEQCARHSQPVLFSSSSKKEGVGNFPLASWEEARSALWNILDSNATSGQPGTITLSNVKRLFRSRFGLELSETSLGYSRLNELLQDERLSDICSLETFGKSQTVVQRLNAPKLAPPPILMSMPLPAPATETMCVQESILPPPIPSVPVDMGNMQVIAQPVVFDEFWQAVPVAPLGWAPVPMGQTMDMMAPVMPMPTIPWEASDPSNNFMYCQDGGFQGNPDFAPDMGAFPPYGRRTSKEILSEYLEHILEHQHAPQQSQIQDVTGHVLQALCSPAPKAHKHSRSSERPSAATMGQPNRPGRDRDHHGGSSVSTAASSAGADRKVMAA